MLDLYEQDRRLYLVIHSRLRAQWLDPIMVWFTKAGTKGMLWLGLSAGLFIDGSPHARYVALMSVAALLLSEGVTNGLLKPLVRRERPFAHPGLAALLVNAPGPHSWPSAHASSSFAAAGVLAFAYPLWAVAFLLVALLVAYSRVYVGVHYPLDVVAGLVLGLAAAMAIIALSLAIDPLLHLHLAL